MRRLLSLTRSVAEFVATTVADAIPASVRKLATRSVLDGIGLALAGQAAPTGPIMRQCLADLGCAAGPSAVLGPSLRVAPRFVALAPGIAIHAHDYDDAQLAVAPDRVSGLLTHPTAESRPVVRRAGGGRKTAAGRGLNGPFPPGTSARS